jgi:hypothetical protein
LNSFLIDPGYLGWEVGRRRKKKEKTNAAEKVE